MCFIEEAGYFLRVGLQREDEALHPRLGCVQWQANNGIEERPRSAVSPPAKNNFVIHVAYVVAALVLSRHSSRPIRSHRNIILHV